MGEQDHVLYRQHFRTGYLERSLERSETVSEEMELCGTIKFI